MKQENKIVGLYPLTKFYLAIVLVVLDIIMPGILSKLVVFVIINIIAALSDVWKSFIRKVRNSVGVLFVILLFIQTFFYPRGEVIFSFYDTVITLANGEKLYVVVEILHRDSCENDEYMYGCRFVGIGAEDQFKIEAYQIVDTGSAI